MFSINHKDYITPFIHRILSISFLSAYSNYSQNLALLNTSIACQLSCLAKSCQSGSQNKPYFIKKVQVIEHKD